MTAPGNSVVIFALLALFVACAGYAAGRLHQRYQTDRDREEAYRDGYDTATRSVFSLAARVIAPRRAVRASAPALPADGSAPPGLNAGPVLPGATVSSNSPAFSSGPGPGSP